MNSEIIKFGGELNFLGDYQNLENDQWVELCRKAQAARESANAGYSDFRVGCALLLDNDQIVIGANQENAVYPLSLCAERVALFSSAVEYPNNSIVALAVATEKAANKNDLPPFPCGSCRQVIHEFEQNQNQQIVVLVVGAEDSVCIIEGSHLLLPFAFSKKHL